MTELLTILEDLYDAERLLAAGEWLEDPLATAQAHNLVRGAILSLETATEFDRQDRPQNAIEAVEQKSS